MLFPTLQMTLELRQKGYKVRKATNMFRDYLSPYTWPGRKSCWYVKKGNEEVARYTKRRFFGSPEFHLFDKSDEVLRDIGKKYAGSNPWTYLGPDPASIKS